MRTAICVCLLCCSLPAFAAEWNPALFDGPYLGGESVPVERVAVKIKAAKEPVTGVLLRRIMKGGFYDNVGLPRFSVVVAVNGWRIDAPQDVAAAMKDVKAGDSISIHAMPATVSETLNLAAPKKFTAVVPSRRDALMGRLVIDEDRVTGTKWVKHALASKGAEPVSTYFQLKDDKAINLRVLFKLQGPNFVIPVKIGVRHGETYTPFPVNFPEVGTRIGTPSSSWVDWSVDEKLAAVLAGLATAEKGIMRFEGRDEVADKDLDEDECQRIGDMLLAFRLRGGDIAEVGYKWYVDGLEAHLKQGRDPTIELKPYGAEAKPKVSDEEKAAKSKEEMEKAEQVKAAAAAKKLMLAKTFIDRGDKSVAAKRLKEIISQYPGTPAAAEAETLLKKVE